MTSISKTSLFFTCSLAGLALLFVGVSFSVYHHYSSTLTEAQQSNQLKIGQTVAQSLGLYFEKLRFITEEAVNTDLFRPDRNKKEDDIRFEVVPKQIIKSLFDEYDFATTLETPKKIYKSGNVPSSPLRYWQLFKGLPATDASGNPLASARRDHARNILKTLPDLHYAFEMDINGDLVFLEPFDVQKDVSNFNYEYRDYLHLVKQKRRTAISEGYLSHDSARTQIITVASPIFDRSNRLMKVFAVSVSANTLQERIFHTLQESMKLIDGTVFYFVDRHGHIVASSNGRNLYFPSLGKTDDSEDIGNIRNVGFFRDIEWRSEQLEKGNIWSRGTKSWNSSFLKKTYFGKYRNLNNEDVFGTFYPTSLIQGQPESISESIGVLVETPVAKFVEAETRLKKIFLFWGCLLIGSLLTIGLIILRTFSQLRKNILDSERQIIEVQKQVSHNLRSPLTSLESLLNDLHQLPEGVRIIMRTAISRIRDITNALRAPSSEATEATDQRMRPGDSNSEVLLIAPIVEDLVSEKRIEYQRSTEIEISSDIGASSYGLFAQFNASEFKCLLSNLINNSIEAMEGPGKVEIFLYKDSDGIRLDIQDNGHGIPADILDQLNQKPFSHNKPSGQGLGLQHAKDELRKWNGRLKLNSSVNKGTCASIYLPAAQPPLWFVPNIDLTHFNRVVILDDDPSIHSIWDNRIAKLFQSTEKPEVRHFNCEKDFTKFVSNIHRHTTLATLYLVDYELHTGDKSGLTLIEDLNLHFSSILVTSRWDEPEIIQRCTSNGIKILPKSMAPIVPLSGPKTFPQVDCILIDDDPLVGETWNCLGADKNKKAAIFENSSQFIQNRTNYSNVTPIYIDSNLGPNERGEETARKLHELGHANIYLVTGQDPEDFPPMPWIKDIRGKEAPW